MKTDSGWFKVSRKVFSHPIADDKPWDRLSAWLFLISLAAHDDFTTTIRQHQYPLKRGRLAISLNDLAGKTGWTVKECRTFLAWLRKHEMIKRFSDHASTFILIVNYDKWQGIAEGIDEGTEEGKAGDSPEQPEEDEQGTEEGIATGIAKGTPREESPPCIPLKKQSMRMKEKDSLPTLSKSKPTYSATMNYETGKFEITAEALAKLDQDHPTVDLEAEIKNAEGWCLDTAKKHKIINGMSFLGKWMTKPTCKQRDVVTRFNSGPLAGQIYRVNHSGSQAQANKRPEPVMNISKFTRK